MRGLGCWLDRQRGHSSRSNAERVGPQADNFHYRTDTDMPVSSHLITTCRLQLTLRQPPPHLTLPPRLLCLPTNWYNGEAVPLTATLQQRWPP